MLKFYAFSGLLNQYYPFSFLSGFLFTLSVFAIPLLLNTGLAACHNESQTPKTGGEEKERGLFKCWLPEKTADFCPAKLSSHLSAGRGFYQEGGGDRTKKSGGRELWMYRQCPFWS